MTTASSPTSVNAPQFQVALSWVSHSRADRRARATPSQSLGLVQSGQERLAAAIMDTPVMPGSKWRSADLAAASRAATSAGPAGAVRSVRLGQVPSASRAALVAHRKIINRFMGSRAFLGLGRAGCYKLRGDGQARPRLAQLVVFQCELNGSDNASGAQSTPRVHVRRIRIRRIRELRSALPWRDIVP